MLDRRGSSLRVISVTSGKGGVGKSSVVANLALAFAKKGKRVLLLDGDFGLANLDIMMGVKPRATIADLLHKDLDMRDIIVSAAEGVDIIPASSGVMGLTNLTLADKTRILDAMTTLDRAYDVLLIDTGAGINEDVVWLNSSGSEVVVVATPEPTSITDAYALIKVMNQKCRVKNFKLLVNQTRSDTEGLRVYQKIVSVSDQFLDVGIDFIGAVAWDEAVSRSIHTRRPIVAQNPHSRVAKNFITIADDLFKKDELATNTSNVQFFWKALLGHA